MARRVLAPFLALLALGSAVASAGSPPRLSGVVVGPNLRLAIFAERATARTVAVLSEGARFGEYTVQVIEPGKVLVIGPAGIETLVPEAATEIASVPALPGLPPAELASLKSGMQLGQLALRRDNCVRGGLLPSAKIDGEARLKALIALIANVPRRVGEDAKHDAPVAAMSAAMSAGLEAARRSNADRVLDIAVCTEIGEAWSRLVRRYGLP